jgi:peptidoglycan/LPS O-acetylase OafA/YrhL
MGQLMRSSEHLKVLDGWRGLSVALVLATHLLPLSPKAWQFNHASGVMGMAMFFILSGFLITSMLLKGTTVPDFLLRRVFRIIPLAWLYLAFAFVISEASAATWIAHFLFYANLPPVHLMPLTDHLWSVCVEMQFYIFVAAVVGVMGVRGLYLLPLLCVLVTGLRIQHGAYWSSVTYFRVDEILAGCTLALIYHGHMGLRLRRMLEIVPPWALVVLLMLSCLAQGGWMNYFRPYLAAGLIGVTLVNPRTLLVRALNNRLLAYLATISYALYVIHPILAASWLGSGDIIEKYSKRPLLFLVLFCLAHLSTYYYEKRWIALGKFLAGKFAPAAREHYSP